VFLLSNFAAAVVAGCHMKDQQRNLLVAVLDAFLVLLLTSSIAFVFVKNFFPEVAAEYPNGIGAAIWLLSLCPAVWQFKRKL
jgi:uncharacterized membrane protein YjjP (DUF1212 family)